MDDARPIERSARTMWKSAIGQMQRQFSTWVGHPITLTGPQFNTGRHKLGTNTGWIDYVTPQGFGFGWEAPGAWGQEHPSVLRVFVAWTDLWASTDRTQLEGVMATKTPLGTLDIDLAQWVSDWAANTMARLPVFASNRTPIHYSIAGQKGANDSDRLSKTTFERGLGIADRTAGVLETSRTALVGAVPVS